MVHFSFDISGVFEKFSKLMFGSIIKCCPDVFVYLLKSTFKSSCRVVPITILAFLRQTIWLHKIVVFSWFYLAPNLPSKLLTCLHIIFCPSVRYISTVMDLREWAPFLHVGLCWPTGSSSSSGGAFLPFFERPLRPSKGENSVNGAWGKKDYY